MGLENTIALLTGIFGTDGNPGVITESFNLDRSRNLTCTKNGVTTSYFLAGCIDNSSLVRIVVRDTTPISGRERYNHQSGFTILGGLRFSRESQNTPFLCYDTKSRLTIGQRLVVIDQTKKILRRYVEPRNTDNNYNMEFVNSVEEFNPTSIRFSMRKKEHIKLFVEDSGGDYELCGCERLTADDYILVNRKDPNEIYLAKGVGFSRITNPLLRIDIFDSSGKRHPGLSGREIEITTLYTQHTRIVRKAEGKK